MICLYIFKPKKNLLRVFNDCIYKNLKKIIKPTISLKKKKAITTVAKNNATFPF